MKFFIEFVGQNGSGKVKRS